ncbi:MAG: AraC family transcriptional regulator [Cytophagales bacterium]|nr:MAG: AraC family transcriptional regulator [Cytophagales bacterium]
MLITNVLTAINSIVLFLLLYFRANNSLSNKLLASIFLVPGLYFISNILVINGYIFNVSFIFFFVQIIASAYPIIIHFYINLLMRKKTIPHPLLLIGSIALLLYISFITFDFYQLTVNEQRTYLENLLTEQYPPNISLYTSLFYFWQMVYFSYNTISVSQYYFKAKQEAKTISLHFRFVIRFVALLWLLNFILLILYIVFPIYIVDLFYLPISVSIIFFFILYFSYHYNAIFNEYPNNQLYDSEKEEITLSKKYVLNENNSEKHQIIYSLIQNALEVDKVYLNPELSLKILSNKLGYPPYLVSQTINSFYKKNFFDLINEKRVNEAHKRIKASSGIEKIENIAYEVGFNSRTSFYRAYKKNIGITPSNYNELSGNE